MATWSRHELQNLKIKTKSIEQTLVPLVTQITTLVNAKARPIKSQRTIHTIVQVGQAVNIAIEQFVNVGEAIADDNPEIRQDIYEACRDARNAGAMMEQVCEIHQDYCGGWRSCADKTSMVHAAKTLLSSVAQILLLADTVVVKQLILAKEKVVLTLDSLENVTHFTEFVRIFNQFGNEMVELAHLTGDRQNDLKSEKRHSQMAAARQILERSMMMLLTSSKTCLRHPDCLSAQKNRDTVFKQVRKALDLVHFVVRDGISVEREICGSAFEDGRLTPTPSWKMEDLDLCMTIHSIIQKFESTVEVIRTSFIGPACREQLTSMLSTIIERTQDFTDCAYTSHSHRKKIILLCNSAKLELNHLLRIGCSLDKGDSMFQMEEFEASILQMLRATKDLRQELEETALNEAEEVIKIIQRTELLDLLRNASSAGDCDKLEEYAGSFCEMKEHVHEVCKLLHHVANTESLQVTSKHTEICVKVYGSQIITSCHTLCLHPTSKIARENLDIFFDMWQAIANDFIHITHEINELCRRQTSENAIFFPLPQLGNFQQL
ncbi:alpha-catulin-like [Centruroides vittatus]|uniref:alpha-catulin-like n=1 Tax=Centruroides vittatus TaxID=120091 RepID=UPI00350FB91A